MRCPQMHFNASHHICGARIKTYLLEKSRCAATCRMRGIMIDHTIVIMFWEPAACATYLLEKEVREQVRCDV